MEIKLNGICRGDGVVYVRVALTSEGGNRPETLAAASAATSGGTRLPLHWIALGDWEEAREDDGAVYRRNFVAILPLLTKGNIVLSVTCGDDARDFTIRPNRAKWESRFNHLLNKELAAQVRGIEKPSSYERLNFELLYSLPDQDNILLRIKAWTKASRAPGPSDVEFAFFDEGGKRIGEQLTSLGDSTVPARADSRLRVWERELSVRVPAGTTSLTACALQAATHEPANGFSTFIPEDLAQAAETGKQRWQHAALSPHYHEWFCEQRATPQLVAYQRERAFDHDVRFSIVVPLFRTPADFFCEMANSVTGQSYGQWELVLVNASPDDEELARAVAELAARDARVKTVALNENRGITENTNAGIKACTGDYICFLDHDDTLEPDALYEYACAVEEDPAIDLIYCDEDKLSAEGRFAEPYLKPDFDPFLIRNYNCICHFLCVSRRALAQVGTSSPDVDGAQDHDLTLRVAERAAKVHHVRRVLYHWRISDQSTASLDATADGVKSYADDAGARVLSSHLKRLDIPGSVTSSGIPYVHRIQYHPQGNPLISIVIPNKDCSETLETCVNSILDKTSYGNFEIVIVENNGVGEAAASCCRTLQDRDARVNIVARPAEFSFSKMVNFGVESSQGDYLVLLDSDTEVISPDWLERMLGICQLDGVGAVGARLFLPDDTIQHAGVIISDGTIPAEHAFFSLPKSNTGYFHQIALTRCLSAVTAACMMTSRAAFDAVGGFDERYAVSCHDVDFCLKLRELGKLVVYEPQAQLYHYEPVSQEPNRGSRDKLITCTRETALLKERWAQRYVDGDPYFNPQLSHLWHRLRYPESE